MRDKGYSDLKDAEGLVQDYFVLQQLGITHSNITYDPRIERFRDSRGRFISQQILEERLRKFCS